MKWKLGRIFGIDVYVHGTFFLLLLWIALSHYLSGGNVRAALFDVFFTLLLFGIVVLHELGHALTARHFGIKTRDITLLPIGGVASLERLPTKPSQELLVALAGPAVNVVLALFLVVGLSLSGYALFPENIEDAGLLVRLLWINLSLAIFNLLPAFPMDGGRALRALLAIRRDYAKATRIAASIGQGFAIFLGLVGIFANSLLLIIAVFVWVGAGAEANAAESKAALHPLRVSSLMMTDFRTVRASDSLRGAAKKILTGFQRDFLVLNAAGDLVGVLPHQALLRGLSTLPPEAPVEAVMQRSFPVVFASETADQAVERMEVNGCQVLPVIDGEHTIGMITAGHIEEFLQLQAALSTPHAAPPGLRPVRQAHI